MVEGVKWGWCRMPSPLPVVSSLSPCWDQSLQSQSPCESFPTCPQGTVQNSVWMIMQIQALFNISYSSEHHVMLITNVYQLAYGPCTCKSIYSSILSEFYANSGKKVPVQFYSPGLISRSLTLRNVLAWAWVSPTRPQRLEYIINEAHTMTFGMQID